jgi:two-component system sensor histidine kinase/response regulator
LIDNAGKYSEDGSTITISTDTKGESIIIKVKDEGVGIRQEDGDKLFKKFSRIENHLTSKTQGNGLGLYITKQLVESMNGSITFESEENKGTVFIVTFPVFNEEEALKCSQKS